MSIEPPDPDKNSAGDPVPDESSAWLRVLFERASRQKHWPDTPPLAWEGQHLFLTISPEEPTRDDLVRAFALGVLAASTAAARLADSVEPGFDSAREDEWNLMVGLLTEIAEWATLEAGTPGALCEGVVSPLAELFRRFHLFQQNQQRLPEER